jgi:hypothetical protein
MQNNQSKQVGDVLNSIGWFVPPYVGVGLLETVTNKITNTQPQFTENDLEKVLGFIYTPDRLASMVVSRYAEMPVVDLYRETIAEAISAHFSGLRHVAVGGLIPVVEGVGRELARQRMTEEPSLYEGLAASALLAAFLEAETISNPFDLAPDESSRHLLAAVLMNGGQEIQPEQVEDAFHSLRHSRLERRQRELQRSMAEAELRNDTATVQELMTEKMALDRALREG